MICLTPGYILISFGLRYEMSDGLTAQEVISPLAVVNNSTCIANAAFKSLAAIAVELLAKKG